MKVLLIAPKPPPYGGIGNWVNLILKYNAEKCLVDMPVFSISPKLRVTEGRSLIWDRIIVQGSCMLGQIFRLIGILRKRDIDVAHMTTSGELAVIRDIAFMSLNRLFGVPTVYHIRIGRVSDISSRNTMEWRLMRIALKLAGKVISLDSRTTDAIRKHVPGVDVVTLPNPLDDQYKKCLGDVCDNRKEILYVGWVIPTKGVEELLAAWQQLAGSYPDWHLRLIGPVKDDYKSFLAEQYPAENVVICGEFKHDAVLEEMAKCSLFILPSHTEGFPNVILEAMAFSKPIISTRVGAIPDILAEECGILIDRKRPEQIVAALKSLLDDPALRERIGQNAYAKMNRLYTVDIVFAEYMKIWQKLVEKN